MAEPAPPAVEVVTLGEAMLVLAAPPGTPLDLAPGFTAGVAGAEINVATGLARLGHPVRFVTRVGDDFAGDLIRRAVRADSIDSHGVGVEVGAVTGLLFRDVHADRPLSVSYRRAGSAASRLSPDDVPALLFAGARYLYLSGITPMLSASAHAATRAAMAAARAAGVAICIDPNVRQRLGTPEQWRAVVGPLLAEADVVLAGEDELATLLGPGATSRLLEQRDATVVTRAADKSATAHTRTETVHQPAFLVQSVDPVGAGDAFTAGFLSARLRGTDLTNALEEAATVAALVVASVGDTPGLPTPAIRDHARLAFVHSTESTLR